MSKTQINLSKYRSKDSRVFTGRDRGEDVRKRSKIDELESTFDEIEIIIPENTFSINPSFLEELFVNVVQKLGKKSFYVRFKFTCTGSYRIEKHLQEAVDRILRRKSILE